MAYSHLPDPTDPLSAHASDADERRSLTQDDGSVIVIFHRDPGRSRYGTLDSEEHTASEEEHPAEDPSPQVHPQPQDLILTNPEPPKFPKSIGASITGAAMFPQGILAFLLARQMLDKAIPNRTIQYTVDAALGMSGFLGKAFLVAHYNNCMEGLIADLKNLNPLDYTLKGLTLAYMSAIGAFVFGGLTLFAHHKIATYPGLEAFDHPAFKYTTMACSLLTNATGLRYAITGAVNLLLEPAFYLATNQQYLEEESRRRRPLEAFLNFLETSNVHEKRALIADARDGLQGTDSEKQAKIRQNIVAYLAAHHEIWIPNPSRLGKAFRHASALAATGVTAVGFYNFIDCGAAAWYDYPGLMSRISTVGANGRYFVSTGWLDYLCVMLSIDLSSVYPMMLSALDTTHQSYFQKLKNNGGLVALSLLICALGGLPNAYQSYTMEKEGKIMGILADVASALAELGGTYAFLSKFRDSIWSYWGSGLTKDELNQVAEIRGAVAAPTEEIMSDYHVSQYPQGSLFEKGVNVISKVITTSPRDVCNYASKCWGSFWKREEDASGAASIVNSASPAVSSAPQESSQPGDELDHEEQPLRGLVRGIDPKTKAAMQSPSHISTPR
jgi:hypothetical protein